MIYYYLEISKNSLSHYASMQLTLSAAPSDLQTPLPLPDGVYLIAIINKTPLGKGNCLITEMGVAHTVGLLSLLTLL